MVQGNRDDNAPHSSKPKETLKTRTLKVTRDHQKVQNYRHKKDGREKTYFGFVEISRTSCIWRACCLKKTMRSRSNDCALLNTWIRHKRIHMSVNREAVMAKNNAGASEQTPQKNSRTKSLNVSLSTHLCHLVNIARRNIWEARQRILVGLSCLLLLHCSLSQLILQFS